MTMNIVFILRNNGRKDMAFFGAYLACKRFFSLHDYYINKIIFAA